MAFIRKILSSQDIFWKGGIHNLDGNVPEALHSLLRLHLGFSYKDNYPRPQRKCKRFWTPVAWDLESRLLLQLSVTAGI